MGRQALVTLEHVKTAVEALRSEGRAVSSRSVREKLGNVGSMGTVNKLLQQCLGDPSPRPDSLRQLPAEIQSVVLAFADMHAESARRQIAEELMNCKSEMNDLADDNDRLVDEIADLREQLANANSSIASAEGRIAQLNGELHQAREGLSAERAAAEAARLATVKLQMRVEALAPLTDELRDAKHQCELERTARAQAEQNVAVLETKVSAFDDQVRHLGVEVEDSRGVIRMLNAKVEATSEALVSERDARVLAERDLAVMSAVRSGRHPFVKLGEARRRKIALQQRGNGDEGNSAH